jgi:ABC-type lipoprotein release transport system permease subunit
MLVKMAWRNLWRKKKRTLITITALTAGVCGIVFMHSVGEAMWGTVVKLTTSASLGHIQVRSNGYQDEPAIYKTVPGAAAVAAKIQQTLPDAVVLPRVQGFGLAAGDKVSSAAMIMGLEPARERDSGLLEVVAGRALAEQAAREVVVGKELATQLEVTPGGELVLLGAAADGSMANDLFKVVGLVDAGTPELNGNAIILHVADAQDFFGLQDGVHQILVNLPGNPWDIAAPLATLRAALDPQTLEVLSWNQIAPELATVVLQKRSGWYFLDFVVFFIVALGVFNVVAMSTFERTREFGVMASLGTRRRRVLGLVLTEALLLGALALAVGLTLTVIMLHALGSVDTSALAQGDMMGFRFPSHVEVRPAPSAVVAAIATVLLTTLAGALWPAWKASRLKPVEAVRYV